MDPYIGNRETDDTGMIMMMVDDGPLMRIKKLCVLPAMDEKLDVPRDVRKILRSTIVCALSITYLPSVPNHVFVCLYQCVIKREL